VTTPNSPAAIPNPTANPELDDFDAVDDLAVELVSTGARRAERVPGPWACVLRGVFQDGASRDATIRDASVGGVFVETAAVLEQGDALLISFGSDMSKVTFHGRVRWVSPFGSVGDPTPGMGIEFVGVDADKRSQLERLLRPRTPRS
jgi:hypothetical protein